MANCEKLTFTTLSKMAKNALWAEKQFIDLGMLDQANKYHRIWCRLSQSMLMNIKEHGKL